MKKKLLLIFLAVFLSLIALVMFYFYSLKPVDKNDDTSISFVIEKNTSTYDIINNLKAANLIRNVYTCYIYYYLHDDIVIKAGTFTLNRNMSLEEVFETLNSGKTKEQAGVNITLKEGLRYNQYLSLITQELEVEESDFEELLNDSQYLKELIDNYWFLTSDILNDNIYYVLEGYLYPDTYNFTSDATAKTILTTILDNTQAKLAEYETLMTANDLSIHEIFTLASIVELEGKTQDDRSKIVEVFLNRMNINMPLGSDVTTYYAVLKDFSDDLTTNDINTCNNYNTRCSSFLGLPISPICSPSIESLKAVLYPDDNQYLYFVSDIDGNIYFSNTYQEHQETIEYLTSNNMWYEYE